MKRLLISIMISMLIVVFGYAQSVNTVAWDIYKNMPVPISKGEFTEKVKVFQIGLNDSTGTSPEDVTMIRASYTYLTAGEILSIISTSDDDSVGGSGAETVTIIGLDSSFLAISEHVSLSGTDTSETTSKFVRIFDAYIDSAGSGGTSAGDISVKSDNGSTLLGFMPAGQNRCLMAHFTVPANKTFYLTDFWGSAFADSVSIALHARPPDETSRTQLVKRFHKNTFHLPLKFPLIFEEKTDLSVKAKVESGNGNIEAGFGGWYE